MGTIILKIQKTKLKIPTYSKMNKTNVSEQAYNEITSDPDKSFFF